jgi:catechol 2,3-dioxygenase
MSRPEHREARARCRHQPFALRPAEYLSENHTRASVAGGRRCGDGRPGTLTDMSPSLHPKTTVGPVWLIVSSLRRTVKFYTERLGFQLRHQQDGTAYFGAGAADLLIVTESPDATRVPGTTGLYHFAILLPTRLALARSLRHLFETGTRLQGAADHLVSEALYLADPDGNGIELYRDRPKEDWTYDSTGLRMTTDPLDVDGLLSELTEPDEPWRGLPPETILGHIHLQVADLAAAEAFYRDVLGLDLTTRYGRSASFLSAGGYHHHIAINTWAGVGAPPPPAGSIGLREFVVKLPNAAELETVVERVSRSGTPLEETSAGVLVRDPSQNTLRLTSDN